MKIKTRHLLFLIVGNSMLYGKWVPGQNIKKVAEKVVATEQKVVAKVVATEQKVVAKVVATEQKVVEKGKNVIETLEEKTKNSINKALQMKESLDPWIKPNQNLRYDQVCYLASHNSFANLEEGFLYSQQKWSLEKQLARGVRCFLLDFHLDTGDKNIPKLCHGDCDKISEWLQVGQKPRTIVNALEMLKKWLDANKDEILTLDLENYISEQETYNVFKQAGLLPLILTPKDWDPVKNNGWPTLKWMIQQNKRLVVLDTQGSSDPYMYAYKIDVYTIRNMYGTLKIEEAAKPRGTIPSPKPYLYELVFVPTVTKDLPDVSFGQSSFANTKIKELYEAFKKAGYLNPDQKPNFIVLDNVQQSNPMEWVNKLNQESAAQLIKT